ncbi:unnamed protein product [Musa textilis]
MRSRGVLRCANVVGIHLFPIPPPKTATTSVPITFLHPPNHRQDLHRPPRLLLSQFCLSCIYKRTPLRILRPGVSICLKKNSPLLAWSLHLGPDKV